MALAGCTADKAPLIERINAYRSAPQTCAGRKSDLIGPLAPAAALARIERTDAEQSLQTALQRAGYPAAQAQAIVLIGPRSASSAMSVLRDRYCEVLSSTQFSEIGISREDNTWLLILAQPLLPPDLGGWREAGREVLRLVNEARSAPRTCGAQRYQPAAPVQWQSDLASAALVHSGDMAQGNYFAHAGRDGSTVGERAARVGYAWQGIGENIATGQSSPAQVVSGWLASPGHCVNIMQPGFTEMGAAYAVNLKSDTMIYWTQVFGTPRR